MSTKLKGTQIQGGTEPGDAIVLIGAGSPGELPVIDGSNLTGIVAGVDNPMTVDLDTAGWSLITDSDSGDNIIIAAGSQSGSGLSSDLTISGGDRTATATAAVQAGNVIINAGDDLRTDGTNLARGGDITIESGSSTTTAGTGLAGSVNIKGGNGKTAAGAILLTPGVQGGTVQFPVRIWNGTGAANTAELQFLDLNGSNYIGLKPPTVVAADVTYTLPVAPTTNGDVLASTTAGVLSWTTPVGAFSNNANNSLFVSSTTAGDSLTTGPGNFLAGVDAGTAITTAGHCIAIGDSALEAGNSQDCVAIGRSSLLVSDSTNNIAIGVNAADRMTTTSQHNVILGAFAGRNLYLTGNNSNIAIGRQSMGFDAAHTTVGTTLNTAVGDQSLRSIRGGDGNVAIGASSAIGLTTGNSNICIGVSTGGITTGNSNICIGNGAGPVTPTVNNKLFIDNIQTDTPLLGADFTANTVDIEGDLNVSGNTISHIAINTRVSSYTLTISDDGQLVPMNVAGANTLTVPPNASVAFPIGTQILVEQNGAGQTTITAGAGVTLNSAGGLLALASQYSMCTLIKKATNTWLVAGDLA